MELEKNSKFKIGLVIIIFIMIILLSAYVVINKIIEHENEFSYSEKTEENTIVNPLIEDSKEYMELSLKNKEVLDLYNMINNIDVDEKFYLMKNTNFNWSNTSSVVLKSLNDNLIAYKNGKKYIDSSVFDSKYNQLFGEVKIGVDKTSTECDTVSFDIFTNEYLVNDSCIEENVEMKTFLKNITYNKSRNEISINKYYVFMRNTTKIDFFTDYEGKDLFSDKDLKQIIVQDIKEENISNYIYNMNIISYVFKKDINGNYYLNSVK